MGTIFIFEWIASDMLPDIKIAEVKKKFIGRTFGTVFAVNTICSYFQAASHYFGLISFKWMFLWWNLHFVWVVGVTASRQQKNCCVFVKSPEVAICWSGDWTSGAERFYWTASWIFFENNLCCTYHSSI